LVPLKSTGHRNTGTGPEEVEKENDDESVRAAAAVRTLKNSSVFFVVENPTVLGGAV
jgi:hypothetical protein